MGIEKNMMANNETEKSNKRLIYFTYPSKKYLTYNFSYLLFLVSTIMTLSNNLLNKLFFFCAGFTASISLGASICLFAASWLIYFSCLSNFSFKLNSNLLWFTNNSLVILL